MNHYKNFWASIKDGFTYTYKLYVGEKLLEQFARESNRNLAIWRVDVNGSSVRVALEKDSLDVWVGAEKIETEAGFIDEGSEQNFILGDREVKIIGKSTKKNCCIK